MFRITIIYGALAGAIVIATMLAGIALSAGEKDYSSQWIGYSIMVVTLSLIFAGVKRHRDVNLGGVIKFFPAFIMGLGISAVAGVIYVVVWEAYLAFTGYAFIHDYAASALESKIKAGIDGAALEAEKAKMAGLIAQYGKPYFRLPMTFMEIFPVGALISLITAGVLRNPKVLPARE